MTPSILATLALTLAGAPDESVQPRLAILALNASGVPEAFAAGVTESLAASIQRTELFDTVSPSQISSLLAYETRRDLLGDCVNEACYTQVAQAVRASYLVTGLIAKVDDLLVLNLVLLDAKGGASMRRTTEQADSAAALLSGVEGAAVSLLQPILQAHKGYVRLKVNVPDARLVVDDTLRNEGPGQVIALPSGPHSIRVERDGFYTARGQVLVRPGRVTDEAFTLIPAQETIDAFETRASMMRYGAYASGIIAIGAAVTSAVFYERASADKLVVDRFSNALSAEQAVDGRRDEALAARDSFQTNQAVYIGSLVGALVGGAASLLLFVTGDDPDRYEEFHDLQESK